MASKFGGSGTAVLGTNVTAFGVIGSATIRCGIYDAMFGTSTTPADQQMLFQVQKTTTAGTSTSVTPEPLDVDDRVAICTAGKTFTAEPTYSGVPFIDIGLNQRSTFRWVARPGGELICSSAANAGIMGKVAVTSGTPTAYVTFHWFE